MPGVRLIETDSLDDHRVEWDALVERQAVPTPFQRSWWLASQPHPDPRFLLVTENERLIGGIALARDHWWGLCRYRLLGQGVLCPDHLDLMAAPGDESRVARAFGDWWSARTSAILDVSGVVAESLLARCLPGPVRCQAVAPFQRLPPGTVDYLGTRSASLRRSVRRSERRLAGGGVTHRRVLGNDVPGALEAMLDLHRTREGRSALLASFEELRGSVLAAHQVGEVRIDVMADQQRIVAVSLAFTLPQRLFLYQLARSTDRAHDGAGTVLLAAVIAEAAREDCLEVDFLRGDEDYKRSFTDSVRTLHGLRRSRGRRARALVVTWNAVARLRARVSSTRARAQLSGAPSGRR